MGELKQTSIETERLILRPFRTVDANDIFEYASQSEVTEYLPWRAHRTIEDSQAFLDWIQTTTCNTREEIFFVYAIYLKSKNKVIGSIDLKNTNKFGAQIDYVLGKPFWGKGLMTEAATALKLWVFDSLPEIVRIQAYCQPENIGSRRVMEKVGMAFEGLRAKSLVVKNKPVDTVHYALIRIVGP